MLHHSLFLNNTFCFCARVKKQVMTTGLLANGRLDLFPKRLLRKLLTRITLEAGGMPWKLCTSPHGHSTGPTAKSQVPGLSLSLDH